MPVKPFRIDVLVYEGCIAAEAFAIADVLNMANALVSYGGGGATARFAVSIASVGGRSVRTSAGATIVANRPSAHADMLVVPGLHFARGDELVDRLGDLAAEVRHVCACARRSMIVASVCVGGFILGEAGILDRRRVTTAWITAGLFKHRYPHAQLDLDQLLVRDRSVWTTGAVTAAYDLALELTRQHCGDAAAHRLGKMILVGQDRTLQSPFVLADLDVPTRTDIVARACHVMRRQSGAPFDLTALAKACRTSTRTLNRRFRAEMQCSPLQFFHKVRIERAKSLLETTRLPLQTIPGRLGYTDDTTFRVIFKRLTGLTPGQYRSRFVRALADIVSVV